MSTIAIATVPPSNSAPVLAAEADLITRFEHDIEMAGLVGEKENALTVFLCAISAKLDR
jgi:hypothetical protein